MAIKETVKQIRDILSHLQADIEKAEGGNKAASQRVRTGTVKLEKIAKRYRKESIVSERTTKGSKKPAKKAAKAKASSAKSTKGKMMKPKASKGRGRSSSASVHARHFSVRRPSAKLPTAKRIRWS